MNQSEADLWDNFLYHKMIKMILKPKGSVDVSWLGLQVEFYKTVY